MISRFSEYRIMWIMVQFDLPTNTKLERKLGAKFRKDLIGDGFSMFQYSIYVRHCPSVENAEVHKRRVRNMIPKTGNVCMFTITDKQFGNIELFENRIEQTPHSPVQQLELF